MRSSISFSPASICPMARRVRRTQRSHSFPWGRLPSTKARASAVPPDGKPSQRMSMTLDLDVSQILHLPLGDSWGNDHLITEAASFTTFPERPAISRSFPVRRTTLPELPLAHIEDTMHLMHSAVPGSGVYLHPEQLIIRESPDTAAGGS